jgi:hypothetical protein
MNMGERRGAGDAALRDRQVGPGGNGAREKERKASQRGGGAPTGGPDQHSAGARFNLGFKPIQNIQTVQMKFEFLQTLAGSKDTFPRSKNLK